MYNFILSATKEFEKNGRSPEFIAKEDQIIAGKNPIQIYYFARYAKGADVQRLQEAMYNYGSIYECIYFLIYVKGATFEPLLERAIRAKDVQWIKFLLKYGEEHKLLDDIEEIADEIKANGINLDYEFGRSKNHHYELNIDNTIQDANEEYRRFRRCTPKYEAIEQEALYSMYVGNQVLFAQFAVGANVPMFQKAVIMHGDALNMYLFAKEVEGANKQLLLKGARLAYLDYVQHERELREIAPELIKERARLQRLVDEDARRSCKLKIQRLINKFSYREKTIEYIRRIEGLIALDAKPDDV